MDYERKYYCIIESVSYVLRKVESLCRFVDFLVLTTRETFMDRINYKQRSGDDASVEKEYFRAFGNLED